MPDFFIAENQSLKLALPDDMLLVASFTYPSGERVKAGTYFYGSGKKGHGRTDNNIILQDRLFDIFAPLARGESIPEQTTPLVRDFAVAFELIRPSDRIKIAADQNGDISCQLKGLDMGFSEKVALSITPQSNRQVFTAFQKFLSLSMT